jgi:hypothetical protein
LLPPYQELAVLNAFNTGIDVAPLGLQCQEGSDWMPQLEANVKGLNARMIFSMICTAWFGAGNFNFTILRKMDEQ